MAEVTYIGTTEEDYQDSLQQLDNIIADIKGEGEKLDKRTVLTFCTICEKMEEVMHKYYPDYYFKTKIAQSLVSATEAVGGCI